MIFWKIILMDESLGPSASARSTTTQQCWLVFAARSSRLFHLWVGFLTAPLLCSLHVCTQSYSSGKILQSSWWEGKDSVWKGWERQPWEHPAAAAPAESQSPGSAGGCCRHCFAAESLQGSATAAWSTLGAGGSPIQPSAALGIPQPHTLTQPLQPSPFHPHGPTAPRGGVFLLLSFCFFTVQFSKSAQHFPPRLEKERGLQCTLFTQ